MTTTSKGDPMASSPSQTLGRAGRRAADCDLDDFIDLVERRTDPADFPYAADVVDNVLVYHATRLRDAAGGPEGEEAVAAEVVRALTEGPGVVAIRGAFPVAAVAARATAAFEAIITDERAGGGSVGDHFARAGANDR